MLIVPLTAIGFVSLMAPDAVSLRSPGSDCVPRRSQLDFLSERFSLLLIPKVFLILAMSLRWACNPNELFVLTFSLGVPGSGSAFEGLLALKVSLSGFWNC